jgi:hypothetical protein
MSDRSEPLFNSDVVLDLALWVASDTRIVDLAGSLHLTTIDAERVREACWDLYKSRTGREVMPNA